MRPGHRTYTTAVRHLLYGLLLAITASPSLMAQVEAVHVSLPHCDKVKVTAIKDHIKRENSVTEEALNAVLRRELGSVPVGPGRVILVMATGVRTFSIGADNALRPEAGRSYTMVRGDVSSFTRAEELMAFWSDTVVVLDTLVLDLRAIKQVVPGQFWLQMGEVPDAALRMDPLNGSRSLHIDRSACGTSDSTATCVMHMGSKKDPWFTGVARFVFPGPDEMHELSALVGAMHDAGMQQAEQVRALDAYVRIHFGSAAPGNTRSFIERINAGR